MNVDRDRVVAVILDVRNAVLDERACGAVQPSEACGREILEKACRAHGVTVEEWTRALKADHDLSHLYEQSMLELATDVPDPGPYAEISRESSRGTPDPEPQAFARDAKLLNRC
jgi:hypothetical protein